MGRGHLGRAVARGPAQERTALRRDDRGDDLRPDLRHRCRSGAGRVDRRPLARLSMSRHPGGAPLVGRFVRLDPTAEADAPDLFAALDHAEVWAAGYAGGPAARPTDADGWVRRMRAAVD